MWIYLDLFYIESENTICRYVKPFFIIIQICLLINMFDSGRMNMYLEGQFMKMVIQPLPSHEVSNQKNIRTQLRICINKNMGRIIRRISIQLKQLDIFGVPLQLSIQSKNKLYQSSLGGILTFLIYFATALYSTQIILRWLSWQIPPQISSQNTPTPEGHFMQLDNTVFEFSFISDGLSRDTYKQLKDNGSYLYDYRVEVIKIDEPNFYNQTFSGNSSKCSQNHNISYFSSGLCQNINNPKENYLYQDEKANQDIQLYYTILYCDPNRNDKCIDRNKILEGADLYWMYWELILYREDVDLSNGEVYRIPNILYLQYNNDTKYFQNIQIKITRADIIIDNGFLFSNLRKFSIVKDIQAYFTTEINNNPVRGPTIAVSMEKFIIEQRINFPSIMIIISQIISCFQTLVLLGFFITQLNSAKMQSYLNQNLLELYFPQFKNIKIYKSCYGKIKYVTYKDVLLDIQAQRDILKHQKQIVELVQNRLNIVYLIHDINQLQLSLNLFMPQNNYKQYILSTLGEKKSQGMTEEMFYKHFEGYKNANPWQISPNSRGNQDEEATEVILLQNTSKLAKIEQSVYKSQQEG